MFTYDVIDLGVLPGGTSTAPTAMNHDTIVGVAWNSANVRRAITWKNGILTELAAPATARETAALDINRTGVIVGSFGNYSFHAAKWVNGQFAALPEGGAHESQAIGINDAGVIVGSGQIGDAWRGRRWTQGSIDILEGIAPGRPATAYAVDATGMVVGVTGAEATFFDFATRWNASGAPSFIDGFSRGSRARAVHSGVAVGVLQAANTWLPAFWSPTGGGALGLLPGSYGGFARDINKFGQIVGNLLTPSADRACIWNGSIVTDLNLLIDPASGWQLARATCLNDSGLIAGVGYLNGTSRGFLLKPRIDIRDKAIPRTLPWLILAGVVNDAPGVVLGPNGPQPVPPWGPLIAQLPRELQSRFEEVLTDQLSAVGKRGKSMTNSAKLKPLKLAELLADFPARPRK